VSTITTATFILAHGGGEEAEFYPGHGLDLRAAMGKYQAPDSVSAVVEVAYPLGEEIKMVWSPKGDYASFPESMSFLKRASVEEIPPNVKFNGPAIFSSGGLPHILKAGIQNAKSGGTETLLSKRKAYSITGQANGIDLAPLTVGSLKSDTLYPVEVLIETETYYPVNIQIGSNENFWTFVLQDIK
jgi:hypothetical protein